MNGIENITNKIMSDAQIEVDKIIAEAEIVVKAITDEVSAKIVQETAISKTVITQRVEDVFAKSLQASTLERRKLLATERQSLIKDAFDGALEKILNLSDSEYFILLKTLVERAVCDGEGGEILLNPVDHKKYGERLVKEVNIAVLTGKFENVKSIVSSTVGKVLAGEVPNISGIISKSADKFSEKSISLALDTVNIVGGVIIRRNKIELNCAVDAIVKNLSQESASIVFEALFAEGE